MPCAAGRAPGQARCGVPLAPPARSARAPARPPPRRAGAQVANETVARTLKVPRGAMVQSVAPGGAGERAGLLPPRRSLGGVLPGDVVAAVNGSAVAKPGAGPAFCGTAGCACMCGRASALHNPLGCRRASSCRPCLAAHMLSLRGRAGDLANALEACDVGDTVSLTVLRGAGGDAVRAGDRLDAAPRRLHALLPAEWTAQRGRL